MKEIEKIDIYEENKVEVNKKMNEIIDVVNLLIVTHPKMEESAKMRRSFEEHMLSDSGSVDKVNND